MNTNKGKKDEVYMRRCIQLARNGEGSVAPNPMVGAIIVCEGLIIGEGYHKKYGGPHAEVNAIASVREPDLLSKSTMYVSLEPCAHYGKTPPCVDLIVENRLKRVVIGCFDSFAKVNGMGIKRLRDAGIEVTVGVLESECMELNKKFFTFHTLNRPYITLKWAQSSDGFIDKHREEHSSEKPMQFSTPITQIMTHKLRSVNDAILVGKRTALLDNPTLTTRLWTGRNPVRLVIDTRGELPCDLHLFDGKIPTRVYVQNDTSPAYAKERVTIVKVELRRIMEGIMKDLVKQEIQSVIIEGGTATLKAFIDSRLWDEIRVETTHIKLENGIKAPRLVAAKLQKSEIFDGSTVNTFVPESVKK